MYPYCNGNNCNIRNNEMMPPTMNNQNDERFFFAPFLVGGLAGTALGYGLANNNQLNSGGYYPMYYQPYPVYYPSNTTYYFQ